MSHSRQSSSEIGRTLTAADAVDENNIVSGAGANCKTPFINDGDWKEWSVENVVSWCQTSLNLPDDDVLCRQLAENEITGDLLPELCLDDCKELCTGDNGAVPAVEGTVQKAIRFKLMINKLVNENGTQKDELQEQQENMAISLRNLYSTVSTKLQEYQTQYTSLRMDLLELFKNSNNAATEPATSRNGSRSGITSSAHITSASQSPTRTARPPNVNTHSAQQAQFPPHSQLSHSHSHTGHIANSAMSSQGGGPPRKDSAALAHTGGTAGITSEPLKQLRASKEDSCERILKNAMKRHNLNDHDWRQYVLVLGYGDQERIIEMHEKPVVMFKNLKQQGLHPAIMLRRRGDFEEMASGNSSNGSNNNTPGGRL
ncbi:Ste50p KNAG_0C00480 [Huiozyma naganishii CBS 8797]|uniref:Ras-associating domain-containing protein n=1 Tax=Huiozyma naganishii (strain ATCC MYA-139 / BCRC 22969 / CBS 8797 / KCTC 17520 / NBRC 10181 / NCYC 3082 / Yp74L-3) TaxID=1071383 RepID=J7RW15_HUIN7|nr:hypothetical protein KNAG_0C00480 [Kazachstania naganishii CBS 8797]CCK69162.1 hypothetical protein KNAG_0C00480 [Kazachstania naganishii CBS 8797]